MAKKKPTKKKPAPKKYASKDLTTTKAFQQQKLEQDVESSMKQAAAERATDHSADAVRYATRPFNAGPLKTQPQQHLEALGRIVSKMHGARTIVFCVVDFNGNVTTETHGTGGDYATVNTMIGILAAEAFNKGRTVIDHGHTART